MNKNKVEFGTSNFHIGTYSIENGETKLGDPIHIQGMRALSLESQTEDSNFCADDIVYFYDYTDNGLKGDLNMALFPDEFKTKFLNYREMQDGGIAQIKGIQNQVTYIAFEGKGDKEKRRHIFFNVALGAIKREHKTIENGKEVEEESISLTIIGDTKTQILKVSYSPGDEGYEKVFTKPTIPNIKAKEAM